MRLSDLRAMEESRAQEEYLTRALDTWDPDKIRARGYVPNQYLRAGLMSELGELIQVHKRQMRDGDQSREVWIKELGDCLWYATVYTDSVKGSISAARPDVARSARYLSDEHGEPNLADPGFDLVVIVFDVMHQFMCAEEFAEQWVEALIIYLGFDLAEVRATNIAKLADRKARGVIHGKGGDR